MIFSKHILAATCLILLGTACNTLPVANSDAGEEQLSHKDAGCILPEVESMETPRISTTKANTSAGEGEIQDTAGCILPEVTE